MLRRTFVALIAAAALSTQVHAQEAKPLNFGIISTESSTNLKSVWQPVIDDLSRAIGVPTYLADVMVAVALLSVLVATLMAQYRVIRK